MTQSALQLPGHCPRCGHVFSTLVRPQWHMQKKAVVLFLAGILLVFPWAGLLVFLTIISPVVPVPAHPIAWGILCGIILAPGLVVGGLALRIPKATTVRCSQCNWSETFVRTRAATTPGQSLLPELIPSKSLPPVKRKAGRTKIATDQLENMARDAPAVRPPGWDARVEQQRRVQTRARRTRSICRYIALIGGILALTSIWLASQFNIEALFGLGCALFLPTLIAAAVLFFMGGFAPLKTRRTLSRRERELLDD